MQPEPANNSHFRLVAAVTLIIAMIVAFSVWSINNSFTIAISAAEKQAAGNARALSEHAERAFSEADHVLLDTIDDIKAISRGSSITAVDTGLIQTILVQHAFGTPQIGSIFFVNRQGMISAHSQTGITQNIDVSDRDYFSFHRDNPGSGLFISRPFKSRVLGKWRFVLSRPLLDTRGEFDGLVGIAFDIEYFQKFYSALNLGNDFRIVLVHRNSHVLVMQPFTESSMKLDYSDSLLFREKLPHADAGTFQLEQGIVIQSPPRIISYVTLTNFPVVAVLSQDRNAVLAPWKASAFKHAVSTIILCLAVVILAYQQLRQLRRIEDVNAMLLARQEELHKEESHRRRIESQLQQAQKMESVGHLAGGVAHDFNNLLTPIIGYADLLKSSGALTAPELFKIDGILGAAHRAKELTRQLLGFARKQIMTMNLVDLNQAVAEFNVILRRVIRESIDIRLNLHAAPALVSADRAQLEHVLLNLAINAQDAIDGHGSISITTANRSLAGGDDEPVTTLPPGRYIVLTVADTGSGISREIMGHIFEPFFTTKPAGHGTGLGLAMVYGIIRQHDGAIFVESSPQAGTTFTIYLRESEGTLQEEAVEVGCSSPVTSRTTILVVEDNEMVRDMVVHILRAEGHQVVESESVDHALELVEEGTTPFDLLVSDVIMPGMNGPAMYLKMKDKLPGMKALFISGYSNDPAFMDTVETESAQFLQKPFSVEDLLGKVQESLNGTG